MTQAYAFFIGPLNIGFATNSKFFPDYSVWVINPGGAVGNLSYVSSTNSKYPNLAIQGPEFSAIADPANNSIIFSQTDTNVFNQLWVWNIVTGVTTELSNISGANATYGLQPGNFSYLNGQIFFSGLDSSSNYGLWVTNGSPSGTHELLPTSGPGSVKQISRTLVDGNELFFVGQDSSGNYAIWKTDGTAPGTTEIPGTVQVPGTEPVELTVFDDNLYYLGGDAVSSWLYRTDGTTTNIVSVPSSGSLHGLSPGSLTVYGKNLAFTGFDTTNNRGIWISNGTSTGTLEIAGSALGGSSLTAAMVNADITPFGNKILFGGKDSAGRYELYVSDGSATGTSEIAPSAASAQGLFTQYGYPDFTLVGGKVIFEGQDAAGHLGLWSTDGTSTGTTEITAAGASSSGLFSSVYANFALLNGKVYFSGIDSSGKVDLWVTDGTATGTHIVAVQDALTTGLGLQPSGLTVTTPFEVTVSASQFVTYQGSLDGLGGFAVSDSATNISPIFDKLNADANLASINLTDAGVPSLTLTAIQSTNDTAALRIIKNPLFEVIAPTLPTTYYVGGNGTAGTSIVFSASSSVVNLKSNSRMDLAGSSDKIVAGAGSNLGVIGADDSIVLGAGDGLWLGGNGAIGISDLVSGASASVYLSANSRMDLSGSNDTVNAGANSNLGVIGAGDSVNLGAGDGLWLGGNGAGGNSNLVSGSLVTVTLSSNSRMDLTGFNDTVYAGSGSNLGVTGTGDAIGLSSGDALWLTGAGATATSDLVSGSSATVTLSANSRMDLTGSDDAVYVGANSNLGVIGTGENIHLSSDDALWLGGAGAVARSDLVSGSSATVLLSGNSHMDLTGSSDTVFAGATSNLGVAGTGDMINLSAGDGLWLAGAGSTATSDVVYGSSATVTLSANSRMDLTGSSDTVYAGATSNLGVTGTGDTITLGSGDGLWIGAGSGAVVTTAANDSVNDGGTGTKLRIGSNVGTLAVYNFGADATGIVDLLNGVGGYSTAAAAAAALTSDGSGGSLLSLGSNGAIDFVGLAPPALNAGKFAIG